jgi:dTDP-4-dehydrorhamnose reductase
MNLAITGSRGLLGAALARVLGDAYSVRVVPEGDLCDVTFARERLHILADLPHGTYSAAKARRLLGWRPRDNLAHLWARRPT